MKLYIIKSGSTGNGYLLEDANGAMLLIECGVKPAEVGKVCPSFTASKVQAAIVSHNHNDHAGFICDYTRKGIRVVGPQDLCTGERNQDLAFRHFYTAIEPLKKYAFGAYKVLPFNVTHDVPAYGYIIEHAEMGKLLFATDTVILPYTFKGLNHILIEANYDDETLNYNVDNCITEPEMVRRLKTSHMAFHETMNALHANDLSKVEDITLIHLSSRNSYPQAYQRKVETTFGIPCYIATPKLLLNF